MSHLDLNRNTSLAIESQHTAIELLDQPKVLIKFRNQSNVDMKIKCTNKYTCVKMWYKNHENLIDMTRFAVPSNALVNSKILDLLDFVISIRYRIYILKYLYSLLKNSKAILLPFWIELFIILCKTCQIHKNWLFKNITSHRLILWMHDLKI